MSRVELRKCEVELPYPPSVNTYWRHVGAKVLISAGGRKYRKDVGLILKCYRVKKLVGPLAVEIEMHPPDARRRDVDNILKAVLDSLAHGGLYEDDSEIDDLRVVRKGLWRNGKAVVRVREIGDDFPLLAAAEPHRPDGFLGAKASMVPEPRREVPWREEAMCT